MSSSLVPDVESVASGTTTSAASGASAQLIGAGPERNGLQITVDPSGTGTVYFLLGTGTASATNFHFAVAPAGDPWPGMISGVVWRGPIQFFGTGARVAVVEV